MNNSAETARKCSTILWVTGVTYNQENYPSTPEQLKQILILPVHFFQTEEHLSQVGINRPTNFYPSGAWTPLVVEHPGPVTHMVLDVQGFPISINCSCMDKEGTR
jgi:hypothetical protein